MTSTDAPAAPTGPTLPTIRNRLARALLSLALLWTVAAAAAVWGVVRHEVDELLDHALQESGEILYGLLSLPATAAVLDQHPGGALPAPPHQENLVWQIVSGQQVLLHSHGAPATPWVDRPQPGLSDAGALWRLYGLALPGPDQRMLYVAQPAWERREAQLEATLLSALAALVVGLAGAVWVRRRLTLELEPLATLSLAVAHFDPLDRSHPLPAAQRAELLPLQRAVTALGERVAQRLASERAFSAHAAHALRTPLAGIDAQLAVALRECPETLQPRLSRVRAAAQRLQQVVAALLALFRSGAEPQRQPLRLDTLVQRLPVPGLALRCSGQTELLADPDLLTAALANLLDNAARHSATEVRVDARLDGRWQRLEVQDNGPGLAPGLQPALQQELDSGRYQRPLGLGLMLADLVARAHGGRVWLPPQDGSGCRVVMTLALPDTDPAAASPTL